MKDVRFGKTYKDTKETVNTQAHSKKQQREGNRFVLSNAEDEIFNPLSVLCIWFFSFLVLYFLRRNGLLKHVIEEKTEGRTEVMVRREVRCKQLPDNLWAEAGYLIFKKKALDRPL
jgi:hypothetical protein